MLVVSAQEAVEYLSIGRLIEAVEEAFRQAHSGAVQTAGRLHMVVADGAVHVVAGGDWSGNRSLIVTKVNRRWAATDHRAGPSVRGVLLVQAGDDGAPIAVIGSGPLTALRTGAVAAVATRHLAAPDDTLVVGSGAVARACASAIGTAFPRGTVLVFDRDARKARSSVERLTHDGVHAQAVGLSEGLRRAQVVITATSATVPLFEADHVTPGTTILAFGADTPGKQELPSELFRRCAVITDSTPQCAVAGELRHAIESGAIRQDQVRADLAAVVSGAARGRLDQREVVVFDSTGTATADIAAVRVILDGLPRAS